MRRWLAFLMWLGTWAALGADRPDDAGSADTLRWWKGNLHTHTLWSDGDGFPEMVAGWYRAHGYHFLAMSDHNVAQQGDKWLDRRVVADRAKGETWRGPAHAPTDALAAYAGRFGTNWVETRPGKSNDVVEVRLKPFDEYRALFEEAGRFLLLPAVEITHQATNGRPVHIGAVNLIEAFKPLDGSTAREVIARNLQAARESARRLRRPVFIHVNHPNYKWGVTAEDLAALVDEPYFEIWNGVDGDNDPGDAFHPSTDEIWDIANTLRVAGLGVPPLFAVATDDSHDFQGNKSRALPGRAWVMVRARRLTAESVLRALRAGEFYASTGVVLEDVRFDGTARTLALRIRSREGETFVTRFIGTRKGVNLTGQPRLGANGEVLATTLDYRSPGKPVIGEVFREVAGTSPEYTLTGDELYVRAVVVSSRKPDVPSTEFEFERAWTQPAGWSVAEHPKKEEETR